MAYWTTLGELRSKVRSFLVEPEEGFWTDVELNTYINMALRDIARRAFCVEEDTYRMVEAGKQGYVQPYDMIDGGIRGIEFIPPDGGKRYLLKWLPHNVLRTQGRKLGRPRYWSVWDKNIWLYPIPEKHDSSKLVLKADHDKVIIPLPNGDEIQVESLNTEINGEQELALSADGAIVYYTRPDGTKYTVTTTSESGACTLQLKDGYVQVVLPSGATYNWYSTTCPNNHGVMLVHYYKDPEPMQDDTDGVEIDDSLVDALVYYATYLALSKDKETGTPHAQFYLTKYEEMVMEASVRFRQRQVQMAHEAHTDEAYGFDDLDIRW